MGSFLIIILILLGIYTFWRLSRKPKAQEPNAVEKAVRDPSERVQTAFSLLFQARILQG